MNNMTAFGLTFAASYMGATIGNQCADWYCKGNQDLDKKRFFKELFIIIGGFTGAILFTQCDYKYLITDKVSQFLKQGIAKCTEKMKNLYQTYYPSVKTPLNVSQLSINEFKIKHYSIFNFNMTDMMTKAGEFAAELPKDHRFVKSEEVLGYIKDILNNIEFQKNPKKFLDAWKKARGYTEEFRFLEDTARMFFDKYFKV